MANTQRTLICQDCNPDSEKFFLRIDGGYPLRTLHTKEHAEYLRNMINRGARRHYGAVEIEKMVERDYVDFYVDSIEF